MLQHLMLFSKTPLFLPLLMATKIIIVTKINMATKIIMVTKINMVTKLLRTVQRTWWWWTTRMADKPLSGEGRLVSCDHQHHRYHRSHRYHHHHHHHHHHLHPHHHHQHHCHHKTDRQVSCLTLSSKWVGDLVYYNTNALKIEDCLKKLCRLEEIFFGGTDVGARRYHMIFAEFHWL